MHASDLHYFPLSPEVLTVLVLLLGVVCALVLMHVLRYAYLSLGVPPQYVFAVLLLSLLGSYINIPVMQFAGERIVSEQEIVFFGVRYVLPVVHDWPGTIVAVNLGGAVVPTLMSLYLVVKKQLYWKAVVAVAVVALICYELSYPVRGFGIVVPTFTPPLATAIVALLLSRRDAAPLAYIAGSLGTLIGADLLRLNDVPQLGSPVASIGGAGTFDGIFVTGLLAVLLASVPTGKQNAGVRQ